MPHLPLVLSSDSKPFMTDSTVISAATPTQMPSIETQLMKETKNPGCASRRSATPMNKDRGWNIRNE